VSDENVSALDRLRIQDVPDKDKAWWWFDKGLHQKCPQLMELLGRRQIGDDERDPGKLSFFFDEGRLKACLSFPSEGKVAFVTLDTLDGVLERLEGLLVNDGLDWRRDKRGGSPGKPR